MQIFLPEYDRLRDIAEGMIMLAILSAAAVPVMRREMSRRKRAAEIAEKTVPGGMTADNSAAAVLR